jgi:hypothetical protein
MSASFRKENQCPIDPDQRVEELRRLWDIGLASGEPIDAQEAFASIRRRLEAGSDAEDETAGPKKRAP